jgi:hypothetical protein
MFLLQIQIIAITIIRQMSRICLNEKIVGLRFSYDEENFGVSEFKKNIEKNLEQIKK